MSQTKITTDNINTLDASMLTGSALPALNGAALTNIPGVTNSASDPTISTNPSGGVGTAWLNTTSGELFCCTDATAGANVWKNVGSGEGDIKSFSYPGTVSGYSVKGYTTGRINTVKRWSFTSDGNGSDVANLTKAAHNNSAGGSKTHGYAYGGATTDAAGMTDMIEKFQFGAEGTQADVGNLIGAKNYGEAWAHHDNGFHGTGAGYDVGSTGSYSPFISLIQKVSFSSDGNSQEHCNLAHATTTSTGACTSELNGYACGGWQNGSTQHTHILKFSKTSSATGTNVGDIIDIREHGAGCSSETHGYTAAGGNTNIPGNYKNTIERFSFSNEATTNDVGDITVTRYQVAGASSTTHGYLAGGYNSGTRYDIIEKFQYATSANATDVGDLVSSSYAHAGAHH